MHSGSSLYHLNADLLERLDPDLIITQELCKVCAVSYDVVATAARRLRSDPRIISLEPSSLEDVYGTIETLGELTEHESQSRSLIASLRERESSARARAKASKRPRTLLLEWTDPPMSAGHWSPELLEAAGAQCVLGNPRANSQVITFEQIARHDPDEIIVAPCGFDQPKARECVAALEDDARWTSLRAVRTNHVHCVDGNAYVNRPGPRLIDTIEIFAGIVERCRGELDSPVGT